MTEINGNGFERRVRASVLQWIGAGTLTACIGVAVWLVTTLQALVPTVQTLTDMRIGDQLEAMRHEMELLTRKVDVLNVTISAFREGQARSDSVQDARLDRIEQRVFVGR